MQGKSEPARAHAGVVCRLLWLPLEAPASDRLPRHSFAALAERLHSSEHALPANDPVAILGAVQ